jgi:regulator of PEP synthase PpsR (kinase-PPPase family)
MRASLLEKASEKGILTVDLMGPVLTALDAYLGNESRKSEAGILRTVDERYFKRIEAIEFTVKHDDGKLTSGPRES